MRLGKIQVCEFAVEDFCCLVVRACGFFPVPEQANVAALSLHVQGNAPSFLSIRPRHSLVATGVVWLAPSIALVLTVSARPQILAAVIQLVMVSMIYGFVALGSHDFSVHEDLVSLVPAIGTISRFFGAATGPIPLRKPIEICNVHNRVLSPRKWNEAVRLIQRLRNSVALYGKPLAQARHKSSMHEPALCVQNFNTGGAPCRG